MMTVPFVLVVAHVVKTHLGAGLVVLYPMLFAVVTKFTAVLMVCLYCYIVFLVHKIS